VTEPGHTTLDHRAFHVAVAEQVAADQASGADEDDLDRIGAALRRRTQRSAAANLAGHLRALDVAADIDVDAPVESSRAAGRTVKVAVSRLTGWYIGHLAGQMRELAVATARAVRGIAARVDDLERRVDELDGSGTPPAGEP
jgi:hypothetical protein